MQPKLTHYKSIILQVTITVKNCIFSGTPSLMIYIINLELNDLCNVDAYDRGKMCRKNVMYFRKSHVWLKYHINRCTFMYCLLIQKVLHTHAKFQNSKKYIRKKEYKVELNISF